MSTKHQIKDMVCVDDHMFGLSEDGQHLYQWQPTIAEKRTGESYTITTCSYSANIYSIDQQGAYRGFAEVSPFSACAAMYFTERSSQYNTVLSAKPRSLAPSFLSRPWGDPSEAEPKNFVDECKRFVEGEEAKEDPVLGDEKEKTAQEAFKKEYERSRWELSNDGTVRLDAKREFKAGVGAFKSYLKAKRTSSEDSPLRPMSGGLAIKLVELPFHERKNSRKQSVPQAENTKEEVYVPTRYKTNVPPMESTGEELKVPGQHYQGSKHARQRSVVTAKGPADLNEIARNFRSAADKIKALRRNRAVTTMGGPQVAAIHSAYVHEPEEQTEEFGYNTTGREEEQSEMGQTQKLTAMVRMKEVIEGAEERVLMRQGMEGIVGEATEESRNPGDRRKKENERETFGRKLAGAEESENAELVIESHPKRVQEITAAAKRRRISRLASIMLRHLVLPTLLALQSSSAQKSRIDIEGAVLRAVIANNPAKPTSDKLRRSGALGATFDSLESFAQRQMLRTAFARLRRKREAIVVPETHDMKQRTGAKLIHEMFRRKIAASISKLRHEVELMKAREELERLQAEYGAEKERQLRRLEMKECTIQELQGNVQKLESCRDALRIVSTRHFITVLCNVSGRVIKGNFAGLKRITMWQQRRKVGTQDAKEGCGEEEEKKQDDAVQMTISEHTSEESEGRRNAKKLDAGDGSEEKKEEDNDPSKIAKEPSVDLIDIAGIENAAEKKRRVPGRSSRIDAGKAFDEDRDVIITSEDPHLSEANPEGMKAVVASPLPGMDEDQSHEVTENSRQTRVRKGDEMEKKEQNPSDDKATPQSSADKEGSEYIHENEEVQKSPQDKEHGQDEPVVQTSGRSSHKEGVPEPESTGANHSMKNAPQVKVAPQSEDSPYHKSIVRGDDEKKEEKEARQIPLDRKEGEERETAGGPARIGLVPEAGIMHGRNEAGNVSDQKRGTSQDLPAAVAIPPNQEPQDASENATVQIREEKKDEGVEKPAPAGGVHAADKAEDVKLEHRDTKDTPGGRAVPNPAEPAKVENTKTEGIPFTRTSAQTPSEEVHSPPKAPPEAETDTARKLEKGDTKGANIPTTVPPRNDVSGAEAVLERGRNEESARTLAGELPKAAQSQEAKVEGSDTEISAAQKPAMVNDRDVPAEGKRATDKAEDVKVKVAHHDAKDVPPAITQQPTKAENCEAKTEAPTRIDAPSILHPAPGAEQRHVPENVKGSNTVSPQQNKEAEGEAVLARGNSEEKVETSKAIPKAGEKEVKTETNEAEIPAKSVQTVENHEVQKSDKDVNMPRAAKELAEGRHVADKADAEYEDDNAAEAFLGVPAGELAHREVDGGVKSEEMKGDHEPKNIPIPSAAPAITEADPTQKPTKKDIPLPPRKADTPPLGPAKLAQDRTNPESQVSLVPESDPNKADNADMLQTLPSGVDDKIKAAGIAKDSDMLAGTQQQTPETGTSQNPEKATQDRKIAPEVVGPDIGTVPKPATATVQKVSQQQNSASPDSEKLEEGDTKRPGVSQETESKVDSGLNVAPDNNKAPAGVSEHDSAIVPKPPTVDISHDLQSSGKSKDEGKREDNGMIKEGISGSKGDSESKTIIPATSTQAKGADSMSALAVTTKGLEENKGDERTNSPLKHDPETLNAQGADESKPAKREDAVVERDIVGRDAENEPERRAQGVKEAEIVPPSKHALEPENGISQPNIVPSGTTPAAAAANKGREGNDITEKPATMEDGAAEERAKKRTSAEKEDDSKVPLIAETGHCIDNPHVEPQRNDHSAEEKTVDPEPDEADSANHIASLPVKSEDTKGEDVVSKSVGSETKKQENSEMAKKVSAEHMSSGQEATKEGLCTADTSRDPGAAVQGKVATPGQKEERDAAGVPVSTGAKPAPEITPSQGFVAPGAEIDKVQAKPDAKEEKGSESEAIACPPEAGVITEQNKEGECSVSVPRIADAKVPKEASILAAETEGAGSKGETKGEKGTAGEIVANGSAAPPGTNTKHIKDESSASTPHVSEAKVEAGGKTKAPEGAYDIPHETSAAGTEGVRVKNVTEDEKSIMATHQISPHPDNAVITPDANKDDTSTAVPPLPETKTDKTPAENASPNKEAVVKDQAESTAEGSKDVPESSKVPRGRVQDQKPLEDNKSLSKDTTAPALVQPEDSDDVPAVAHPNKSGSEEKVHSPEAEANENAHRIGGGVTEESEEKTARNAPETKIEEGVARSATIQQRHDEMGVPQGYETKQPHADTSNDDVSEAKAEGNVGRADTEVQELKKEDKRTCAPELTPEAKLAEIADRHEGEEEKQPVATEMSVNEASKDTTANTVPALPQGIADRQETEGKSAGNPAVPAAAEMSRKEAGGANDAVSELPRDIAEEKTGRFHEPMIEDEPYANTNTELPHESMEAGVDEERFDRIETAEKRDEGEEEKSDRMHPSEDKTNAKVTEGTHNEPDNGRVPAEKVDEETASKHDENVTGVKIIADSPQEPDAKTCDDTHTELPCDIATNAQKKIEEDRTVQPVTETPLKSNETKTGASNANAAKDQPEEFAHDVMEEEEEYGRAKRGNKSDEGEAERTAPEAPQKTGAEDVPELLSHGAITEAKVEGKALAEQPKPDEDEKAKMEDRVRQITETPEEPSDKTKPDAGNEPGLPHHHEVWEAGADKTDKTQNHDDKTGAGVPLQYAENETGPKIRGNNNTPELPQNVPEKKVDENPGISETAQQKPESGTSAKEESMTEVPPQHDTIHAAEAKAEHNDEDRVKAVSQEPVASQMKADSQEKVQGVTEPSHKPESKSECDAKKAETVPRNPDKSGANVNTNADEVLLPAAYQSKPDTAEIPVERDMSKTLSQVSPTPEIEHCGGATQGPDAERSNNEGEGKGKSSEERSVTEAAMLSQQSETEKAGETDSGHVSQTHHSDISAETLQPANVPETLLKEQDKARVKGLSSDEDEGQAIPEAVATGEVPSSHQAEETAKKGVPMADKNADGGDISHVPGGASSYKTADNPEGNKERDETRVKEPSSKNEKGIVQAVPEATQQLPQPETKKETPPVSEKDGEIVKNSEVPHQNITGATSHPTQEQTETRIKEEKVSSKDASILQAVPAAAKVVLSQEPDEDMKGAQGRDETRVKEEAEAGSKEAKVFSPAVPEVAGVQSHEPDKDTSQAAQAPDMAKTSEEKDVPEAVLPSHARVDYDDGKSEDVAKPNSNIAAQEEEARRVSKPEEEHIIADVPEAEVALAVPDNDNESEDVPRAQGENKSTAQKDMAGEEAKCVLEPHENMVEVEGEPEEEKFIAAVPEAEAALASHDDDGGDRSGNIPRSEGENRSMARKDTVLDPCKNVAKVEDYPEGKTTASALHEPETKRVNENQKVVSIPEAKTDEVETVQRPEEKSKGTVKDHAPDKANAERDGNEENASSIDIAQRPGIAETVPGILHQNKADTTRTPERVGEVAPMFISQDVSEANKHVSNAEIIQNPESKHAIVSPEAQATVHTPERVEGGEAAPILGQQVPEAKNVSQRHDPETALPLPSKADSIRTPDEPSTKEVAQKQGADSVAPDISQDVSIPHSAAESKQSKDEDKEIAKRPVPEAAETNISQPRSGNAPVPEDTKDGGKTEAKNTCVPEPTHKPEKDQETEVNVTERRCKVEDEATSKEEKRDETAKIGTEEGKPEETDFGTSRTPQDAITDSSASKQKAEPDKEHREDKDTQKTGIQDAPLLSNESHTTLQQESDSSKPEYSPLPRQKAETGTAKQENENAKESLVERPVALVHNQPEIKSNPVPTENDSETSQRPPQSVPEPKTQQSAGEAETGARTAKQESENADDMAMRKKPLPAVHHQPETGANLAPLPAEESKELPHSATVDQSLLTKKGRDAEKKSVIQDAPKSASSEGGASQQDVPEEKPAVVEADKTGKEEVKKSGDAEVAGTSHQPGDANGEVAKVQEKAELSHEDTVVSPETKQDAVREERKENTPKKTVSEVSPHHQPEAKTVPATSSLAQSKVDQLPQEKFVPEVAPHHQSEAKSAMVPTLVQERDGDELSRRVADNSKVETSKKLETEAGEQSHAIHEAHQADKTSSAVMMSPGESKTEEPDSTTPEYRKKDLPKAEAANGCNPRLEGEKTSRLSPEDSVPETKAAADKRDKIPAKFGEGDNSDAPREVVQGHPVADDTVHPENKSKAIEGIDKSGDIIDASAGAGSLPTKPGRSENMPKTCEDFEDNKSIKDNRAPKEEFQQQHIPEADTAAKDPNNKGEDDSNASKTPAPVAVQGSVHETSSPEVVPTAIARPGEEDKSPAPEFTAKHPEEVQNLPRISNATIPPPVATPLHPSEKEAEIKPVPSPENLKAKDVNPTTADIVPDTLNPVLRAEQLKDISACENTSKSVPVSESEPLVLEAAKRVGKIENPSLNQREEDSKVPHKETAEEVRMRPATEEGIGNKVQTAPGVEAGRKIAHVDGGDEDDKGKGESMPLATDPSESRIKAQPKSDSAAGVDDKGSMRTRHESGARHLNEDDNKHSDCIKAKPSSSSPSEIAKEDKKAEGLPNVQPINAVREGAGPRKEDRIRSLPLPAEEERKLPVPEKSLNDFPQQLPAKDRDSKAPMIATPSPMPHHTTAGPPQAKDRSPSSTDFPLHPAIRDDITELPHAFPEDQKLISPEKQQSPFKSRNEPYQAPTELWTLMRSGSHGEGHMPNIEDISDITAKGKEGDSGAKKPLQPFSYDDAMYKQSAKEDSALGGKVQEDRPLFIKSAEEMRVGREEAKKEDSQTRTETLKNFIASDKSAGEASEDWTAYKQRGYSAALSIIFRVIRTKIGKALEPLEDFRVKSRTAPLGCRKLVSIISGKVKGELAAGLRTLSRYAQQKRLAARQLRLGVSALHAALKPRLSQIYAKILGTKREPRGMTAENSGIPRQRVQAARLLRQLLVAKLRILVESVKSKAMFAALCGDMKKKDRERSRKEGVRVLLNVLGRTGVRGRLLRWKEAANKGLNEKTKQKSAFRMLKCLQGLYRRRTKHVLDELRLTVRMEKMLEMKQGELDKLAGDKDAELRSAAERQSKSLQEKERALQRSRQRETATKLRGMLMRKLASHFDTLLFKTLATMYISSSDSIPAPTPREEAVAEHKSPLSPSEETYGPEPLTTLPEMIPLRPRPRINPADTSPDRIKVSVVASSTPVVGSPVECDANNKSEEEDDVIVTISPLAKSDNSSEFSKLHAFSPRDDSPVSSPGKEEMVKAADSGRATRNSATKAMTLPEETKERPEDPSSKPLAGRKKPFSPKGLSRFVTKPHDIQKIPAKDNMKDPQKPIAGPGNRKPPRQEEGPNTEAKLIAPMSLESPPSDSSQRSPFTSFPASGRQSLAADTMSMPVTPTKDDTRLKRFQAVEMLNSPDILPESKSKSRISSEENSANGMADPVELETPSWLSKSITQHKILGHNYDDSTSNNNPPQPKNEFITGRLVLKRIPPKEEEKQTRSGTGIVTGGSLDDDNAKRIAARYSHKRFMEAFSKCFVKYHQLMVQEEKRHLPPRRASSRPRLKSKGKFKESPIRTPRLKYPQERKGSNFCTRRSLGKASSEKELRELLTGMNSQQDSSSVHPSQLLAPSISSHKDASKMFRSRLRKLKQIKHTKSRFVRENIKKVGELSQKVSVDNEPSIQTERAPLITAAKKGFGTTTMLQSSGGSFMSLSKKKDSNDYIDLNKQYIHEMSSINHEINANYTCLEHIPRFKVPKPDLVFQMTRYKVHMQSRSQVIHMSSSINTSIAMQSHLLVPRGRSSGLNQSQQQ